jgi:hypothetical protein
MACVYPNTESTLAERCHCEFEDRTESLAKGAPVANVLASLDCSPSHFLTTLGTSSLEEQSEILRRLDRLIDLDRTSGLEEEKASIVHRPQHVGRPQVETDIQNIAQTSEDVAMTTKDSNDDRHAILARGGPLPYLLGSPTGFLSTLANSSLEEQADILMGLEKLIAQESMADHEESSTALTIGRRRRTNCNRKPICRSTRLLRAIRSRPYRVR